MDDNEAMFPEFTSEFNQTSVPMQINEFVEDLILNVENVKKENLQKQIDAMNKKLEKEKEEHTMHRKNKVEHLIKFRQLIEKRANTNKGKCKNCPSLEGELISVKKRISDLLDEQIEASEKVFNTEQAIKVYQVHEEKKLHEIKELKEQIEKRRANTNRHFQTTKFKAKCLRQQIEMDLGSKATDDVILAIQKKVTDLALNKAYDELPNKIALFDEETIAQALKEAKEEIAAADQGVQYPGGSYNEEETNNRREEYMKWLFKD
ncbi:hypothetical protein JTE90_024348 [Oedothorax gibbosus]|uniref:Uncharacterized protein n=1 Tax=Oedothorax gibbosus TaxID=931172 RepID=A0AAV6VXU3_9ARAC|nr:hypothetical protein JTE90_024348 [Oedothorax gibbosus]